MHGLETNGLTERTFNSWREIGRIGSFFEAKSVSIGDVPKDLKKIGGKTARFYRDHSYGGQLLSVRYTKRGAGISFPDR